MRTDTVFPLARQSMSCSASMMFLRARSLSGGATASSRSRKTKSAALVEALSIISGLEPGSASSLRCRRSLRRWWRVWLMIDHLLPLRRVGDCRRAAALEGVDRCTDAGAGLNADAAIDQSHFDSRQSAANHDFVQPTEMADSEHLAGDLVQADAERGLVFVVGAADDLITVNAVGHMDGAYRVGMPRGRLCAEAKAPGIDGIAYALGQPMMPGEDLLQSFVGDQVERNTQAAQELRCRRIREIAKIVRLDHVLERKKAAVVARAGGGG